MSNNPAQQARRTVWRRNRWLVAGVTGVAGLAAISALTGVPDFTRSKTPGTAQVGQSSDEGKDSNQTDGSQTGGNNPKGNQANGNQANGNQANSGKTDDGKTDGSQSDGGKTDAEKPDSPDPDQTRSPDAGAAVPGPDGGTETRDATKVPCDSDRLIAALVRANAGDGGTLELAAHCTYVLTANQPYNGKAPTGTGNGLPLITQPVTLNGENTSIVRAASADPFRIFEVGAGGELTLSGLTVNGGQSASGDSRGGGGILVDAGGVLTVEDSTVTHNVALLGNGGGVANNGTTAVQRSSVNYNSTSVGDGGGLSNTGLLRVDDAKLSYNTANGDAGAISNTGGGLLLNKAELTNNAARGSGGAIAIASGTTSAVRDSTITENTGGGNGGGISNAGSFILQRSTVGRNFAPGNGGGIYNSGQFVIEDGAVTDNTTRANGGGIANLGDGSLVVRRTEVSRDNAIGSASVAGGIFNTGRVALTDSTVIDNNSTTAPGGIQTSNPVTVNYGSITVRNRRATCTPGPANCSR